MATRAEIHEVFGSVPLTMKYRRTDAGWWIAYCEQVPEARTQGESREEVRENLVDAIEAILEDLTVAELRELKETLDSEESELIAL